MAVDLVTPRWSDERYKRKTSASIYFDVTGNGITAEEACAAVPYQKGSTHDLDSRLVAEEPEVVQVLTPNHYYRVQVQFKFDSASDDDLTAYLNEPMAVQWEGGSTSEPVDLDIDGNPMVNSALDPFEPYNDDIATLFLVGEKWISEYDPSRSLQYHNSINSNAFGITVNGVTKTVQPGQVKCLLWAPTRMYKATANKVRLGFRFEFRDYLPNTESLPWEYRSAFQVRRKDQGTRGWYNNPNGGQRIGNIQANGADVSSDVLLFKGHPSSAYTINGAQDWDDQPLPPGAQLSIAPETGAHFLIYRRRRTMNFAVMEI